MVNIKQVGVATVSSETMSKDVFYFSKTGFGFT